VIFSRGADTITGNRFPNILDPRNIERSLKNTLNKDKEEFQNMLKILTKLISVS
jgi:hypothetical protein